MHDPFRNGFLFFFVDECTRWAKGDAGGLIFTIKGSDAFPITIDDGDITFFTEEFQNFNSRRLPTKNTACKRGTEGLTKPTPVA
jgi:hypothetical protein